MVKIISMPKLSDTMEEGGLAEWLKKEGEKIEEGEALAEIETDKATMEFPSPESGFLLKFLVSKGDLVPLGKAIAVIGEKDEKFDYEKFTKEQDSLLGSEPKSTEAQQGEPAKIELKSEANSHNLDSRIKASPLAKKIAHEKGIQLKDIKGTGPQGRVILQDVKDFRPEVSYKTQESSLGENKKIPLTMMRKTIARRLSEAKNDAPHFYLSGSANMEPILKWRKALNESKEKTESVSINDLIIFVVSRALKKHPEINSSWQGDHILQKASIDINIAVALPQGLITPILRHVNALSVFDISSRAKSIIRGAKENALSPKDMESGSFTVSNLGMTQVESFTAIINPPQSCILAVGKICKKVVVDEKSQITVQDRMKFTLSCDHRVVDGMIGAKFITTLVNYMENPALMIAL